MPTLNWIGKDAVVKHHLEVPFHLLKDVPELSCGDPGSGNLIVQSDNLVALKALLPHYAGQVKCIYIDPPYNTGNEGWAYNDNVNSPIIREWLGKVVGKEGETLDRHDRWLCMMYPRLALLRQFLRADGSIWISMDDNEIAGLRFLLDELFGSHNFVTQVEWQKRYTRSNNTVGFTTVVEHILVYRKSEAFTPNLELKGEDADARYRNPDKDPRGPWKAIPFLNPLSPQARPNLCYEIVQPNTGKILTNTSKAWRTSKETFDRYLSENRIYWGINGKAETPSIKRFLNEVRRGMPPINFWSYDVAGHTDTANTEIKDLFGQKIFDTPKPTQLLKRIFEHSTDPGDLILDSFAGSGTTGHAVMSLNKQGSGSRKFILVEMESEIARGITAERVRRVSEGYTNAKGEKIEGLGGGFRFCELGEPLFDETGHIRETVKFGELARHVYFSETREPLPRERVPNTPLLGVCRGVAIYLLFNGILGDKSSNGGNVLTRKTLAKLPPFVGPKVIYCAGCLIGADRLAEEGITVRQTPYEIRVS